MGCNCKKNGEEVAASVRNSDEGARAYRPNPAGVIAKFIIQGTIGILAAACIAVLMVPALLYWAACAAAGREPRFPLINPKRKRDERKQNI